MTQLNKQMLNKKKGFTLTELAIVIAVIAILVAVLVPTFTSILTKARKTTAAEEAKSALTAYMLETEESIADDSVVAVVKDGTTYYFTVNGGTVNTDEVSEDAATISGLNPYSWATNGDYASSYDGVVTIYVEAVTANYDNYVTSGYTVDNSGLVFSGSGTTYYVSGTLSANQAAAGALWTSNAPSSLFYIRINPVNMATSGTYTLVGDETNTRNLPSDGIFDLVLNGATAKYTLTYPTADGGSVTITIYNSATLATN